MIIFIFVSDVDFLRLIKQVCDVDILTTFNCYLVLLIILVFDKLFYFFVIVDSDAAVEIHRATAANNFTVVIFSVLDYGFGVSAWYYQQ